MWIIKNNEIFLNPGLVAVLKSAFFGTPTSFGRKFKAHYVSSHPSRDEPEFPAALVALAATGVSFLSFMGIMTDYSSFRFTLPYTLGRPDLKSITRSSMVTNSKEFTIVTWTI